MYRESMFPYYNDTALLVSIGSEVWRESLSADLYVRLFVSTTVYEFLERFLPQIKSKQVFNLLFSI